MSAGLDVLARMDDAVRLADGESTDEFAAELREARAAVAELIEAAQSGIEALEQLVAINRIPANNAGLRNLRAALARVQP